MFRSLNANSTSAGTMLSNHKSLHKKTARVASSGASLGCVSSHALRASSITESPVAVYWLHFQCTNLLFLLAVRLDYSREECLCKAIIVAELPVLVSSFGARPVLRSATTQPCNSPLSQHLQKACQACPSIDCRWFSIRLQLLLL